MDADRLHVHVDAAYRVAQAVTLDERAAARLVERAFRRAYADDPDQWPDDEVRDRLIRHVIAAHETVREDGGPAYLQDTSTGRMVGSGDEYQTLVARELVDRLLPTALALLPDHARTLLLLIEMEHLSVSDASRIFGREAAQVQLDREEARTLLRDAMMRTANDAEREVLTRYLTADWLRNGLHRYARSRFGPPPPTLALPTPPGQRPATDSYVPGARTSGRTPANRRRARPRRILQSLILIVSAGLLAYVASALFEKEVVTDVVTLSAERMSSVEVDLPSNAADEIESFLFEETNWRVRLPQVEDASLAGVAMVEIVDRVEVPVVLYRDDRSGDEIPMFIYSYALLDRHTDQLRLERDVMQQIEPNDQMNSVRVSDSSASVSDSND